MTSRKSVRKAHLTDSLVGKVRMPVRHEHDLAPCLLEKWIGCFQALETPNPSFYVLVSPILLQKIKAWCLVNLEQINEKYFPRFIAIQSIEQLQRNKWRTRNSSRCKRSKLEATQLPTTSLSLPSSPSSSSSFFFLTIIVILSLILQCHRVFQSAHILSYFALLCPSHETKAMFEVFTAGPFPISWNHRCPLTDEAMPEQRAPSSEVRLPVHLRAAVISVCPKTADASQNGHFNCENDFMINHGAMGWKWMACVFFLHVFGRWRNPPWNRQNRQRLSARPNTLLRAPIPPKVPPPVEAGSNPWTEKKPCICEIRCEYDNDIYTYIMCIYIYLSLYVLHIYIYIWMYNYLFIYLFMRLSMNNTFV